MALNIIRMRLDVKRIGRGHSIVLDHCRDLHQDDEDKFGRGMRGGACVYFLILSNIRKCRLFIIYVFRKNSTNV